MKIFVVFAALCSFIALSECLSLLSANDGDHLQTEFFDKRTALSFLTRHKRHLSEECSTNEGGCRWEEVEEVLTHPHAIKNYMIQWHCRSKTCGAGTKCTNKNNDFSHIYRLIVHCADIDECKQNTHGCTHTCHNTHGSYLCLCHDGYQLHSNERTCIDIKECETDKHDCSQECHEMEGSYSCSCNDGYRLLQDNSTCLDIDECMNPNKCGDLQECVNVPGSFQCQCIHGYSRDDSKICTDIDECVDQNRCGGYQECVNVPGSFHCQCIHGYSRDNKGICTDIDECVDQNKCGNLQECVNIPGSYQCRCIHGYSRDENSVCTDIDECVEQNKCGDLQECVNVPGSYQCQCVHGYSKNNKSICTDIDECSSDKVGCSQGCTNSIGSYHCTCKKGFFLDDDQRSCIGMSPVSADQNSSDNAIMIGSVTGCIGVVVLIVLIIVVIFMLRKRKQPDTSSMSFDNNCYANDNESNGYISVVGNSKSQSSIKILTSSDRPKSENIYSTVA